MGNRLLPLLVVWLCFTSVLYAANTFTVSCGNITSSTQSTSCSVKPDAFSNTVQVTVSTSSSGNPNGVEIQTPSHTFTDASSWNFIVNGKAGGVYTLRFSVNDSDYSTPPAATVYYFVIPSYPSASIDPGATANGQVSLDAPPGTSVTVALVSDDGALTFSPPSFTFNNNQPPYQLPYTVTSTQPGTHYFHATVSGGDAGAVPQPTINATVFVNKRKIYTNPNPSFNKKVGETTGPVTMNVDVAPDDSITVTPNCTTKDVTFDPPSLTFTNKVTAQTFTITGTARNTTTCVFDISGPDADKYIQTSSVYMGVTQRTFSVSGVPSSMLVGVASSPVSIYCANPPAAANPVTITPYSNDSLVFQPPFLTFNEGRAVNTFTATPMNSSNAASRTIFFDVTGTLASWFAKPAPVSIAISATKRNVAVQYSFNGNSFPYGAPVSVKFVLDNVPPTGFTVTPSATRAKFTPTSITFTNSTGSLQQTFTIISNTLGADRIIFTVSGDDAGLVSDIPSIPIIVVQYDAPFLVVNGPATVGVPLTCQLTLPSPVINGLTVSLSSSPSSIPVTIDPATFSLTSPGLDAGVVTYTFTVQASKVGTIIIHPQLSGPDNDAGLFPAPADKVLSINSVSFSLDFSLLPSPATVKVPITGLRVRLDQPHPTTVTLTPSAATLLFQPSSFVFDSAVSEVCVTITPQTAPLASETIVFTSSDPTNYIAPDPVPVGPINQKFFQLGALAGSLNLVVGVGSAIYAVYVNYPPATTVTLTPASTDGLSFSGSLVFDANTNVQYISITANSLANRNPVVTWSVSGDDASSFSTPQPLNQISVAGRSLTVSGDFPSALVNVASLPIVVSSEYSVPTTLTITPSAPDVTFSPQSQTLSGATTFAVFTATYPQWLSPDNSPSISVSFALSGDAASWYNPLSPVNFSPSKRTVSLSSTAFDINTYGPGYQLVVTLEVAPESDVAVNFCAPAWLVFSPPQLAFTTGQTVASVLVTAQPVLDSAPPSPIIVGLDLVGSNAASYAEPSDLVVFVDTNGGIQLSGFPSSVALGDAPTPFEIFVNYLNFAPFTVTFKSQGSSVTFTPPSVTFSSTALHYYVAIQATGILHSTSSASTEIVSFEISGNDGVLGSLGNRALSVLKGSINADVTTTNADVGTPISGYVRLDLPPTSDLTLTAFCPPGVTVMPNTLTFTSKKAVAYFVVTSNVTGSQSVGWGVTGAQASFYSAAPSLGFYFNKRSFSFNTGNINIRPGRLNIVSWTLSSPAVNGLTITPVLPPGLAAQPPSVQIAPGSNAGSFSLSVTGNLHTTDSNLISFVCSGPDAGWHDLGGFVVGVTIELGTVSVSTIAAVEVGNPTTFYITLNVAPVNGLTITPSAPSTNAVSFDSASLVYAPGASSARLTATPLRTGTIPVIFTLSGPDAWLYNVPTRVITSNSRSIQYNSLDTPAQGIATVHQFYVLSPPPSDFTITPVSSSVAFTPPIMQFSPTLSSVQVTYTPKVCGNIEIDWVLGGTDAGWYDGFDYLSQFTSYVPCKVISVDGNSNLYSGQKVQWRATIDSPATVSVLPKAPGCTFDPSPLVFDPTKLSVAFSVVCTVSAPSLAAVIPVSFAVSGNDVALVDPSVDSTDITIYPNVLTVPSSLADVYSGQTFQVEVYLGLAPIQDVTVTPTASNMQFNPPAITFSATSAVTYGVFTVTALSPQTNKITYALSGPGSSFVGLSSLSTALNVKYGTFSWAFAGGPVGLESGPFPVYVTPPPLHDVTFTPTAPGCTFSPPTISFVQYNNTGLANIQCTSVGQPIISFTVSGTDANHYTIPQALQVNIQQRIIQVNFESTSPKIFDDNHGYIRLFDATENGITLTPSSALIEFEPTSFDIPAGGSYFPFKYTGSSLGHDVITWTVSNGDAGWYDVPANNLFTVNKRTITTHVPNLGSLKAGALTDTFSIVLDRAPDSNLVVRPYGAGLTFIPSQLSFTSGQTGASFQVKCSVAGNFVIYYEVTGDDAKYYAQPATTPVNTDLLNIMFDTGNMDDPLIGVKSAPLLVYSDYPPSDTVTLTFVGPCTFEPTSVTLSPTVTAATFTCTPTAIGNSVISAQITSGGGVVDYSDTLFTSNEYYADQRQIRVPFRLPDLIANVPSPLISVSVDNLPLKSLVITPSAAGVAFNPPSIQLSPTTSHAEFSMIASLPAQYNYVPGQTQNLAPTTVTWTLSGDDAGWYLPINNYQVNVLHRDTVVYYPNADQYIGVPFEVTVISTYAPNSSLTWTPVGNFAFSPPSVTLAPGQNSAAFNVTPLGPGDYRFKVLTSGPDAPYYQDNDWIDIFVNKWYFDIPSLSLYQYGEWSAPQIVRTNYAPPSTVTLTISSDYLDFSPSVLTFGPTVAAQQFQVYLRAGVNYLRTTSYTVHFWVGGDSAYLFSTPSSITIGWSANYPARALTLSNAPSNLVVGLESTPFSIWIPNHPLSDLTITPIAYSPHVSFNPPSAHLSRTSTALSVSFTVIVNHPDVTGTVQIALTGADAAFYSPPSFSINSVQTRQVSFTTQALTVGTPSQPFIASLQYPTLNGISVLLESQSIAFSPSTLVFAPGTQTVAFTATGGTVGSQIPVRVSSFGPDVDWHDPAAWNFPGTLNVAARSWSAVPSGSYSTNAGYPFTVDYAVRDAPLSSLIITPTASGVTFSPQSATLSPNTSSVSFTCIGLVGGTSVVVSSVLSGADALLYTPLSQFYIYVNQLSLSSENLGGSTAIDVGDTRDVRFVLNPPVNGLWITPSANGLTFNPSTIYVAPGHSYAHATYTANTVGLSQVRIAVSGPDALLYNVAQPGSVRVTALYLQASSPPTITVGSLSPAVALYSYGLTSRTQRASLAAVNVSFLVSPEGAATVYPSSYTLTPPRSEFQVQIRPNIATDKLVISPVLSGPGAAYYQIIPGQSPNTIAFTSSKRTFTMTDFFNYFQNTNQRQLVVGVETGPFGITANSVPSDVVLYLKAPGLKFIPSALVFTGTYETLYFRILPERPVLTQITFSVGGSSANWFTVPATSPQIRVTHNFNIPSLPTVMINEVAPTQTVEIVSPITSPVVLTPSVPGCGNSRTYVNFLPPFLLFTPNSTAQTFKYIGNCATFNLGSNYNPVITDGSPRQYTTSPTVVSVTWVVLEAGETAAYALSFPTPNSVLGVNVVPATFNVSIGALEIGMSSTVTISVTQAPRSDVVLTLIGNNLNFNPPHVTFFPDTLTQTIQVNPVHADFKDSGAIPFTIDYIVSGSNWQDYVPPAQSFVGVARGNGAVVGGISGSDASVTQAAMWSLLVFVVGVLLSN